MNWDAIGATGEVVGAAAVVFTIVYLAIQVGHAKESTKASTELEASIQMSRITERSADDSRLQLAWDLVAAEEDLEPDLARHYLWHVSTFVTLAEGFWEQHQLGNLSDRSWGQWERNLQGVLSRPFCNNWWKERLSTVSPEFYDYVDDLIEQETNWSMRSGESHYSAPS